MSKTNAERLYENARANIAKRWGDYAWRQLPSDVRQGLIAHALIVLLDQQDASISDATVRGLLAEFRDHLIDEAI